MKDYFASGIDNREKLRTLAVATEIITASASAGDKSYETCKKMLDDYISSGLISEASTQPLKKTLALRGFVSQLIQETEKPRHRGMLNRVVHEAADAFGQVFNRHANDTAKGAVSYFIKSSDLVNARTECRKLDIDVDELRSLAKKIGKAALVTFDGIQATSSFKTKVF